MSKDLNIFDEALPQDGEFFNFKEVGDSIQGTYIDSREGTDSYDNEQTIYVIKDSEDKVWNVGFRNSNVFVNERMSKIKLGQIVGFRFDEERDTKKGANKAKIIKIYADNKFIDKEWLAAKKELDELSGSEEKKESFEAPKDTEAATVTPPEVEEDPEENDALNAIRQLAKTKGVTKGAETPKEEDEVIEVFAGLKLTEDNFTKIIVKLTGYTEKK